MSSKFTISDEHVQLAETIALHPTQQKKGARHYELWDAYGEDLSATFPFFMKNTHLYDLAVDYEVDEGMKSSLLFKRTWKLIDLTALAYWLQFGQSFPVPSSAAIDRYHLLGHTDRDCEKCMEKAAQGRQRCRAANENLADEIESRLKKLPDDFHDVVWGFVDLLDYLLIREV